MTKKKKVRHLPVRSFVREQMGGCMSTNSPFYITGVSLISPFELKDNPKQNGLSQRDVAIFCNALGLGSTDESWYDEFMDDPMGVGMGIGTC